MIRLKIHAQEALDEINAIEQVVYIIDYVTTLCLCMITTGNMKEIPIAIHMQEMERQRELANGKDSKVDKVGICLFEYYSLT